MPSLMARCSATLFSPASWIRIQGFGISRFFAQPAPFGGQYLVVSSSHAAKLFRIFRWTQVWRVVCCCLVMIFSNSILKIHQNFKRCFRLLTGILAGWGLFAGVAPAAGILTNSEFTGSLDGWTLEGTVFNTGDQAVFSDAVAGPVGLFQSAAVGAEFAGFQISFDVLTGGLSPTVSPGFLADSFFATVYLGSDAFGPTLAGGVFDEAVGLFDVDADGFFNVAAGAIFGGSPKGAEWTRYTLTYAMEPLFDTGGFLTLAFQFFDLNGIGSDSTVVVDNVEVTVLSAPLRWVLPGNGVWDTGATANWRLLGSEVDVVFTAGAAAVFDGAGGVVTIEAAGVLPGGVTVMTGGYTFAGGEIGGAGGLVKSGAGLLVLESANSYGGGTVVTGDGSGASGLDCFCAGGVLEKLFCGGAAAADAGSALWVMNAAGSATGSGPVSVGAGGMLGGAGTVAGAVTVAGGEGGKARLVPGLIGPPGGGAALNLPGSLTLGAGSEVVFRLGHDGSTMLVAGQVALVDAGARFRVVLEDGFIPQPGAEFDVFDWQDGPAGGDLDWADNLILPPGIHWDSDAFSSDGVLKVRAAPLTPGIVGTFTGPVGRDAAINGGLGGTVLVKVTAKGAFSGTHDEGGKRRRFKGALVVDPDSPLLVPVSVVVARGRNVTPHTLAFTLDGSTGRLIDGSLTDGVNTAPVAGWRNPWGKLNRATALQGYYTASIGWMNDADAADDTLPQGFGFLAVTVNAKTGGVKLSGRLMDGSAVSGSTFAGPNGQVLVFRRLYAKKVRGSVLGMAVLTPMDDNKDNTLTGCVGWNRPENLAKSNRLFRAGFAPRFLDVRGGRYTPPGRNERILGLTDANGRALLTFARAGIETALPLQADTSFALSAKNKAAFVAADNTRRITFSVAVKTGLFKGRLTLKENNPLLLPGKESPVTRRVSYQGILIGRDNEGAGYALVPQLPTVEGETPKNTAILNAGVLLEPAPPP